MKIIDAYKFCPLCGGNLTKAGDNGLKCSSGDHPFYVAPRTTACAAIIDDAGRILLAKRGAEPFKGTWELPGGFVNPGEEPDQALVREIKEELGVEIIIKSVYWIFSADYPYKGIDYPVCVAYYLVSLQSSNIQPNEEVAEYRYFSREDLPTEIGFPTDVKFLKKYSSS